MAVSGVPKPSEHNAERIMKLAIGMFTVAEGISKRFGHRLDLRIGIATGPITAGVIGTAKFAYDVWSPTVNLAARLESSGKVGGIHVSQETYRAVKELYVFEKAPPANLKGLGKVRSWYFVKEPYVPVSGFGGIA